MDWLPKLILLGEGVIFLASIVLIVIFGIRAYNKRQEETFEERDN